MPEKNKLHNFIVERLMASDNIDDIVLEICQDGKISWNEAEALVRQVEEEQRTKIERFETERPGFHRDHA
jgi:Ribonuclease G/E